ncbi:MAG TPA: hypothetical protein VFR06_01590, partial [Gallionellaceae bacterium]|nr:hypothetical protein [Gallionellaceae bacterium]
GISGTNIFISSVNPKSWCNSATVLSDKKLKQLKGAGELSAVETDVHGIQYIKIIQSKRSRHPKMLTEMLEYLEREIACGT